MRHRTLLWATFCAFILGSTYHLKAEMIVVGSDVPGIEIGAKLPDDWKPEKLAANRSVRVLMVRPGKEPEEKTFRGETKGEVDFRLIGTLRKGE